MRSDSVQSLHDSSSRRVITFCAWESQSRASLFSVFSGNVKAISKCLDRQVGLHSAILLYTSPLSSERFYPFHKDMPKSALPKAELKIGNELCCEKRDEEKPKNADVVEVDAYISFVPPNNMLPGFVKSVFNFSSKSSEWCNDRFRFFNDVAYEEAVREYFEYKKKKEERLPEVRFTIPIKTKYQHGLDYDRMQLWWALVNKSDDMKYKYFSMNCSMATLMALRAGGAEKYLKYISSIPIFPHNPKSTSIYASKLKAKIKSGGHHADPQKEKDEVLPVEKPLIKYVKDLVGAIFYKNRLNQPMPSLQEDLEEPIKINTEYDFGDFNKKKQDEKKSYLFEHRALKKISKLLTIAEKTKYDDVRLFYLRKVQARCAEFVFHHPEFKGLNEMANLMESIDRYKNKNLDLWNELNNEELKALIMLKRYSESEDQLNNRYLFNFWTKAATVRAKKKAAIEQFFKENQMINYWNWESAGIAEKLPPALSAHGGWGYANELAGRWIRLMQARENKNENDRKKRKWGLQ
jgi:hypothetical protein